MQDISLPSGILNPVWLYVPANLKIPASHRDVENEICYWLHVVITGQYNRKHDLVNTTRINRQTIRQILHPTKDTKARRWLLAKKIIYTDHSFCPGEFSKSYGLNPKYQGKFVRWQVTNPTVAAKISHHRLQRHDLKDAVAARSAVFDYLQSWANRIQIATENRMFYRLEHVSPSRTEHAGHLVPGQMLRPASQEPAITCRQVAFPPRPRHSLHRHATTSAVHPPHGIHKKHGHSPQGYKLELPLRQPIVTRPPATAAGANRPAILAGMHLHFDRLSLGVFHQSDFSVGKGLERFNPIEDSL